MKKQLINILAFATGAITGGFIAYKLVDKKYQQILDKEMEAVKEHANSLIKKYTNIDLDSCNEQQLSFLDDNGELINTTYAQVDSFQEARSIDEMAQDAVFTASMGEKKDISDDRKDPYIISATEFCEEMPHFSKVCLSYYEQNHVFINDEDDEVLDDPRYLIGDAYEYFGCNIDEPNVVYIRNYKQSTDYELTRLDAFYSDILDEYGYETWDDDEEEY